MTGNEDYPVCDICGDRLHDGHALVDYIVHGEVIGMVHASCAQELRGEAEG